MLLPRRLAVLEAFKRMYGVQLDHELDSLLHMPNDGDTWSVMQSWVLPTRSFLEFVMFSRYMSYVFGISLRSKCYCAYN